MVLHRDTPDAVRGTVPFYITAVTWGIVTRPGYPKRSDNTVVPNSNHYSTIQEENPRMYNLAMDMEWFLQCMRIFIINGGEFPRPHGYQYNFSEETVVDERMVTALLQFWTRGWTHVPLHSFWDFQQHMYGINCEAGRILYLHNENNQNHIHE